MNDFWELNKFLLIVMYIIIVLLGFAFGIIWLFWKLSGPMR